MATVGNVKIVISEKIVLLLHPHVDVRTVWLFRNISLDGKLCVSLAVAGKHDCKTSR